MEEVLEAKLEAGEWKTQLGPPAKACPQIVQFYTLPPLDRTQ